MTPGALFHPLSKTNKMPISTDSFTSRRSALANFTLFLGSAAISAVLVSPTLAPAASWRQYPASACNMMDYATDTNAAAPQISYGEISSQTVRSGADLVTWARLYCPIVEDEGHGKGGTRVQAIFNQGTNTWNSYVAACVNYESASGGHCSADASTAGAAGLKTVTVSSTAGVWQTAADFGYLYIKLGGKSVAGDTSRNYFKGYWTTTL
jgi:hypothetical protein